jgi:hypothetical protein
MRIIVGAKSAFGVLNADDNKWYNPKDKELLNQVKIGKAYDIVLEDVKGKNGKNYKQIISLNEVQLDAAPTGASISKEPSNEKKFTKAFVPAKKAFAAKEDRASGPSNSGLSFAQKDARILIQGLTQAVLNSPAFAQSGMPDRDTLVTDVEAQVIKLVAMVKKLETSI